MLGPGTTLVTLMNGLPYWWRTAAGRHVEAVDPGRTLSSALPPLGRVIGSVGFVAGTRVFDHAAHRHRWLNKWPTDQSSLLLGSAAGGTLTSASVWPVSPRVSRSIPPCRRRAGMIC